MRFIAEVVHNLFTAYIWILFARIILSWFPNIGYSSSGQALQPLIQFVYQVTEPIMRPFRQIIPPIGSVDISPILLFILLRWVQSIVYTVLIRLG